MKSAPAEPNSSCARLHGNRDSGGGIRGGSIDSEAVTAIRFFARHSTK
jgi:hypothetical protein